MALDPSIILGIRKPTDPMEQYARAAQIQGLQNQNRLADLQFSQAERQNQRQNKLAELLGGGGAPEEVESRLLQGGYMDEALKFGKERRENLKSDVETKAKQFETTSKKLDIAGQAFGFVKSNPTPAAAAQTLDFLEANGIYTKQEADRYRQVVAQDPGSIASLAEQAFRSVLSAKDQLAKYETQNLGGTSRISAIDPVTGKATTVNETAITQSADNKASNDTSRANNAATVGASYANAAATRSVGEATRDAAKIAAESKRVQDTEMKLADDYRTESKGFAETSTAMKKVLAAITTADKNPGSALAAGTGFMKILDPNSVVRETELGMALNASGWFDRATNIANTLRNGRVMTAEQKVNLKKAAEDLFEEAKKAQLEVDAAYKRRADAYKLDSNRIITDRGQGGGAPTPSSDPLGLRKK